MSIKQAKGLLATISRFWGVLGLALVPAAANAAWRVNFQTPVTGIARDVLHLHMTIFWICVVIFIMVFSVMFYSIAMHRKSRGFKPATFRESTKLEIIWTIIPFVILVVMALPSTATLLKMADISHSDMTVKITGYQWKWQYQYMGKGVSFFSTLSTPWAEVENKEPKDPHYLLEVDHPLVLPIHKKIRFLVTAADVIHSWWVPALAIKKDAIPGFVNQVWTRIDKPGVYRGQCAELCGRGHAFMPIVVKAVTQKDFDAWLKKEQAQQVASAAESNKTWSKDKLMKRGKEVFAQCEACHGAKGVGIPGVFPPLAAGHAFSAGENLLKGIRDRGFLSKDNKIVMGPVKNHLEIVLNGIPGTAMAAFAKQLSDVDIAAVVTYERNSFGNTTGDVVQPSDVKALRK